MNFRPKTNILYRYVESGNYFIVRKIENKHIEIDYLKTSTSTFKSAVVEEWGNTKHKFKKVKDIKLKTKIGLKGLI
jgi:hypothetical protein